MPSTWLQGRDPSNGTLHTAVYVRLSPRLFNFGNVHGEMMHDILPLPLLRHAFLRLAATATDCLSWRTIFSALGRRYCVTSARALAELCPRRRGQSTASACSLCRLSSKNVQGVSAAITVDIVKMSGSSALVARGQANAHLPARQIRLQVLACGPVRRMCIFLHFRICLIVCACLCT